MSRYGAWPTGGLEANKILEEMSRLRGVGRIGRIGRMCEGLRLILNIDSQSEDKIDQKPGA